MDTNSNFVKLCPSQEEEMVPLGFLCYSNMLMHREDLKDAIYSSPYGGRTFQNYHHSLIFISENSWPLAKRKRCSLPLEKNLNRIK
jgi:hypothetical protein